MQRRRRTDVLIAGDREAANIASSLGRDVGTTRRRRRIRQADLAAAVGLTQSRISEIERGKATGTPLVVWARIGAALQRPLAMTFSREIGPLLPTDAGHLEGQELVLRLARATGRTATLELPTRPASPSHSVDVCVRDDPHRTLILHEIWNRFDDFGAALRSTDRKVAEASTLAALIGSDESPYRIAVCWLLIDNAANRAMVARYPEAFATRFPGSSFGWTRALTAGEPVPDEPGVAWLDLRAQQLVALRRRVA